MTVPIGTKNDISTTDVFFEPNEKLMKKLKIKILTQITSGKQICAFVSIISNDSVVFIAQKNGIRQGLHQL